MSYDSERMPEDRRKQVQALLNEASKNLSEAASLTEGFINYDDSFRFVALGYGAGATLRDGEWNPSSLSC